MVTKVATTSLDEVTGAHAALAPVKSKDNWLRAMLWMIPGLACLQ
jgi:hypothetical protein